MVRELNRWQRLKKIETYEHTAKTSGSSLFIDGCSKMNTLLNVNSIRFSNECTSISDIFFTCIIALLDNSIGSSILIYFPDNHLLFQIQD
jgi:hypothetical protein